MTMNNHICGCYYMPTLASDSVYSLRVYLPQVELKSHTTILSTSSRTVLKQAFINPSSTHEIQKLRYTFPLYDSVSVVGFKCIIGDRIINGIVKEKDKARAVFNEAVNKGQQAGLLEQLPDASDVFTTAIGNVPAVAKFVVEITYLGELKNDAEVDGIRFTIPTAIAPRYGNYPGTLASPSDTVHNSGGMEVVVDTIMPDGSFIKAIQSPSHRISVSIGTVSSDPCASPKLNQASASLTLGSIELDSDFVLQVLNEDTGKPQAFLETHPTIRDQRALMLSLVPKFVVPKIKPEIVFVADRSGSMRMNVPILISAMNLFLKSLPVGVMFNICSFGTSHSFLWSKSRVYGQASLDEAQIHTKSFAANYGGTEMCGALEATIQNRHGNIPLEIVFLTDGDVWGQERIFEMLNRKVKDNKAPIRVFTLGIGSMVSHALIEGIARAGNGFSQVVGEGEKLDRKVVRMLKGALTIHVNDYSLDVCYGDEDNDDDDYELIDKVEECLKLDISAETPADIKGVKQAKPPVSLYEVNADPDKDDNVDNDNDGNQRYDHLPDLSVPKILQAPNHIPPLFPFDRTTVYLLLSPDSMGKSPKSVILRGTSEQGPLELEIPVQVLETPGETIHQLAAKKAIQELEEGHGWIFSAKDKTDGALLKDKMPGQFQQMVEREAVRLGVQFQVGGKWCSFVAVETNSKEIGNDDEQVMADSSTFELEFESLETGTQLHNANPQAYFFNTGGHARATASAFGATVRQDQRQKTVGLKPVTNIPSQPAPTATDPSATTRNPTAAAQGLFGASSTKCSALSSAVLCALDSASDSEPEEQSPMEILISLQNFEGFWSVCDELFEALGVDEHKVKEAFGSDSAYDGAGGNIVPTVLAICFLQYDLADHKEIWELIVDKAKSWLEQAVPQQTREKLMSTGEQLMQERKA